MDIFLPLKSECITCMGNQKGMAAKMYAILAEMEERPNVYKSRREKISDTTYIIQRVFSKVLFDSGR